LEGDKVQKPRRWYSSPEYNPIQERPAVHPNITLQHLQYVARVKPQHGRRSTLRKQVTLSEVLKRASA